jgi:hypothetical protein
MRHLLFVGILAGLAQGQTMLDVGAAVTGGSAGVAAGKAIHDATSPLGKAAKQLEQAAGTGGGAAPSTLTIGASTPSPKTPPAANTALAPAKAAGASPVLDIGPGVPKGRPGTAKPGAIQISGGVPLPPPAAKPAAIPTAPKAAVVEPILLSAPPAPPPPPPQMTTDDLKQLSKGMTREEVLKFGAPASRITMFEDGHLLESFRYANREAAFGHVRLIDGQVSVIELR